MNERATGTRSPRAAQQLEFGVTGFSDEFANVADLKEFVSISERTLFTTTSVDRRHQHAEPFPDWRRGYLYRTSRGPRYRRTCCAGEDITDGVAGFLNVISSINRTGRGFPDVSFQEGSKSQSMGRRARARRHRAIALLTYQLITAGKSPMGFLNPFLQPKAARHSTTSQLGKIRCNNHVHVSILLVWLTGYLLITNR
ncbi:hypothetical protein GGX14DRAFT_577098 [Mycena pura]|uniref:Uncharacterized protein n=1 Tax=Mycena pura TaxID=153505 RepID=A0AAD6XZB5_9AGAR|nr:hypothetical protein GGX14DRAFT_577098 [Mycena pura]